MKNRVDIRTLGNRAARVRLSEERIEARHHALLEGLRRARHLVHSHLSVPGVMQHEISERAADVESDSQHEAKDPFMDSCWSRLDAAT